MFRVRFSSMVLCGGLLLSALLLWFVIANFRSAHPIAESILRGISLSLGQAIESVAIRDPSLNSLAVFKSNDIAYFSILDRNGYIRFHSNPDLIGEQINDRRFQPVLDRQMLTEERIRLGTGEIVFETQQQVHLTQGTLILRLALHTWQADQIIHRARTGVVVMIALLLAAWGLGIFSLRLQRRDLLRLEELARHAHLVRLGELGAIMAHEVRTPLAGIKGFAQLLEERLDEPSQQQYAARIVSESVRLEGLVSDLLSYARQEAQPAGTAVLAVTLQDAWSSLAAEAEKVGVTLQTAGSVDRQIACPQDRLYQLLLNLFSNAIQAMPEGGTLRVKLASTQNRAVIVLADSGPGFSEEGLQRAFEPFYTTRSNGSGLGLAVCQKIVAGYNGEITATNGGDGGAVITLQLPLVREQS